MGTASSVLRCPKGYDPEKFKNLLYKYELEVLNQFTFDKNAFLIENKSNKLVYRDEQGVSEIDFDDI